MFFFEEVPCVSNVAFWLLRYLHPSSQKSRRTKEECLVQAGIWNQVANIPHGGMVKKSLITLMSGKDGWKETANRAS